MLKNETPMTNLNFYSNKKVKINLHWILISFAIPKNYLNVWNFFPSNSMEDSDTTAVEARGCGTRLGVGMRGESGCSFCSTFVFK